MEVLWRFHGGSMEGFRIEPTIYRVLWGLFWIEPLLVTSSTRNCHFFGPKLWPITCFLAQKSTADQEYLTKPLKNVRGLRFDSNSLYFFFFSFYFSIKTWLSFCFSFFFMEYDSVWYPMHKIMPFSVLFFKQIQHFLAKFISFLAGGSVFRDQLIWSNDWKNVQIFR